MHKQDPLGLHVALNMSPGLICNSFTFSHCQDHFNFLKCVKDEDKISQPTGFEPVRGDPN